MRIYAYARGKLLRLKPRAASCAAPSSVIMSTFHAGVHVQSTRNSSTNPARTAAHSSSIRSVNGHAGGKRHS